MIVKPEHWGWDHFQLLMLIDRIIQRKKCLVVAPNPWFRVRAEIFSTMGWTIPTPLGREVPTTIWSRDRYGNQIPEHDDWQVVRDFYEAGLLRDISNAMLWTPKGKHLVGVVRKWANTKGNQDKLLPLIKLFEAIRDR